MKAIIVLALALAACSCGASLKPVGRTGVQQHNAVVKITTHCGLREQYGSGVMVAPDLVLTAAHVVSCAMIPGSELPLYLPPDGITVSGGFGPHAADLMEVKYEPDLARLQVKGLEEFFTPIVVGPPPPVGERVCAVSSVPYSSYRCGEAQEPRPGRLYVDFLILHGNSGSGMYDSHGRLVGIVTNLIDCPGCGGFGSTLAEWRWLVPAPAE